MPPRSRGFKQNESLSFAKDQRSKRVASRHALMREAKGSKMDSRLRRASVAWLLTAVFFFYQYSLRSSPSVMMPQLSSAFGLSAAESASLIGLFYYGYSVFSLAAGALLDRLGTRAVIPLGALSVACGALLFGSGSLAAANIGRLLQGAGGAFAFVGAVYIAIRNFPASRAATLIGAAQMFGMAGGSAGQFLVGPLITAGVPCSSFWIRMGVAGLVISLALFLVLPNGDVAHQSSNSISSVFKSLGIVFRNPQSILCGVIAGLLFMPTTIFDMTWGVRFLQEAHGFNYAAAVLRSATVPFGWIIGCPLLGWISDRIGRRKPVIMGGACALLACLAWILYGPVGVVPRYVLGLLTGIASGAAMIPYSVIKEVNPANLGGTATGVINFLNLTLTALLGPLFGWLLHTSSGGAQPGLRDYQSTFRLLLFGVGLALLLTLALQETGRPTRATVEDTKAA
jgi:MFS family permease